MSATKLGARATRRLTNQLRLALEPECLKNRIATGGRRFQRWNGRLEALKLFVGSDVGRQKLTPFFQTVKVIAAILRVRVSRAISGRIPLATNASQNSLNGPVLAAATVAAPLNRFFSS